MEARTFTHFLTLDAPQNVWTARVQQKASILQRGLKALFPVGVAAPLSPIYVKVAQFYVEREENIPRILQGIMDAFNELAESVNMRQGGIIAILGDAEVAGDTAFSPVHLGLGCSRTLRKLLQKHVPETIVDEGYSPRVDLFQGCGGRPMVRLRARTGQGEEQLGALNIATVNFRPRAQLEASQSSTQVINLYD